MFLGEYIKHKKIKYESLVTTFNDVVIPFTNHYGSTILMDNAPHAEVKIF